MVVRSAMIEVTKKRRLVPPIFQIAESTLKHHHPCHNQQQNHPPGNHQGEFFLVEFSVGQDWRVSSATKGLIWCNLGVRLYFPQTSFNWHFRYKSNCYFVHL